MKLPKEFKSGTYVLIDQFTMDFDGYLERDLSFGWINKSNRNNSLQVYLFSPQLKNQDTFNEDTEEVVVIPETKRYGVTNYNTVESTPGVTWNLEPELTIMRIRRLVDPPERLEPDAVVGKVSIRYLSLAEVQEGIKVDLTMQPELCRSLQQSTFNFYNTVVKLFSKKSLYEGT